jgi:hypothetical protein
LVNLLAVHLLRAQLQLEALAHHTDKEVVALSAVASVARIMAAIAAPSAPPSIASTRACFEPTFVLRREIITISMIQADEPGGGKSE